MNETILVALIVSVVAPSLVAYFTLRQAPETKRLDAEIRAEEKAEDYRRQDELAARADKAADRADKAAAAIVEANKHTAEVVASSQSAVLDVANKTHMLVNSAMTVQKELTLTFAKTTLAALQRAAMIAAAPVSVEQQAEISAMSNKVRELEGELVERARQQKVLDDQTHAKALAAANAAPTVVTFAEPQDVRVVDTPPNKFDEPVDVRVVEEG